MPLVNGRIRLALFTILANLLIVVGAGHGVGVLGLIELFWFPYDISTEDFIIQLDASYNDGLRVAALLSLTGQAILLVSIVMKNPIPMIVGLASLWMGFWFLSHNVPSAYHAWQIRQGKAIVRHPLLNG